MKISLVTTAIYPRRSNEADIKLIFEVNAKTNKYDMIERSKYRYCTHHEVLDIMLEEVQSFLILPVYKIQQIRLNQ